MPPPVEPTVQDSMPQPNKGSRRRLLFLVATAVVAGSTGIALGSTLRFQVMPVGQAPLFKPQQDFPPLAKWPPQLPSTAAPESFNTNWEDETSPSHLVYNDSFNDEAETYDLSPDDAFEEVPTSDSSAASPATWDNEDRVQQDSTSETFENNELPPHIPPAHAEEFEHSSEAVEEVSVESSKTSSSTINSGAPWVNKQPLSEFDFSDGPIIVSPE